MERWEDVDRWRKERRAALIEARMALPLRERQRLTAAIVERIEASGLLDGAPRRLGFFWPIRGEPDLRAFMRGLVDKGFEAALPVVVARRAPVEFWRFGPQTKLTRQEVWGIPIPAERIPVRPDVLLIPLVGVDDACYRLGYGGGYYDRTLASLDPKPLSIGVGYELGRLESIYPQPHDVPMDAVVTEERIDLRS